MAAFERVDCILSIGHITEVLAPDVNGILSLGQNTIQWAHGLEDNASCRMRRLRAQVDTGNGAPAKLPFEEVQINALEQGRNRRENAGGADQGWAQPQDEGGEELRLSLAACQSRGTKRRDKDYPLSIYITGVARCRKRRGTRVGNVPV
jgi:hypothetical protein